MLMMPTHDTSIRNMFEAIDAREWERLPEYFTDDVVYERPGFDPIRGIGCLLHFYARVRGIAAGRHDLSGIIVGDATAACWGRFVGTSRDGRALDERFADIYTLRDGKVATRLTLFFRPAI
jgi:ketosteroid isomerase-like protein